MARSAPPRGRVRREELLADLTDLVLVQGAAVHAGWEARHVDPVRGRLVVVPPGGRGADVLAPEEVDLVAYTRNGLLEAPATAIAVEPASATLVLDLARAALDVRRTALRHTLELPVRGRPRAGGIAWAGTTRSVSAAGLLADVDQPLEPGGLHRVSLSIDGTEIDLAAHVVRVDAGGVVLRFDDLRPATRRALDLALHRARGRRSA